MTVSEENACIQKVCAGEVESYRHLIDSYKHMAFTIANSIVRDEFYAEEAVQNSFIKGFYALKGFKQSSKFSTWFYRIVVNEALMLLKKQKRQNIFLDSSNGTAVVDDSYSSKASEEDQKYVINEALKKLATNERIVLQLFYLNEQSMKDIVDITGWSISKIKVLLFRARASMKNTLKMVVNQNI
jgi:RNA polymerase sigma-70 factor (ECF subfamily)